MNVSEIVKLLDAGYTKEEIEKINAPAPEQTAPAPEQAAPTPEPEEKPDAVLVELQKLTKAVYAMNVMNSSQPEQISADDALLKLMKGE